MRFMRRKFKPRIKSGYRSKSEEQFAERLDTLGVPYNYEKRIIKYQKKPSSYKVDFELPKQGIIIEYKGYFEAEDRAKHLLVKEQHPELDIRFIFDRASNTINKHSDTTYADWCDKHGFKWAEKVIPAAWLKETKSA